MDLPWGSLVRWRAARRVTSKQAANARAFVAGTQELDEERKELWVRPTKAKLARGGYPLAPEAEFLTGWARPKRAWRWAPAEDATWQRHGHRPPAAAFETLAEHTCRGGEKSPWRDRAPRWRGSGQVHGLTQQLSQPQTFWTTCAVLALVFERLFAA